MDIENDSSRFESEIGQFLFGIQKKRILGILAFREAIAEHVILYKDPPNRGKSSQSESHYQVLRRSEMKQNYSTSCNNMVTVIYQC